MQWHDVTRKILGGPLGGPGKILGRQWPPWHPLAPPLPQVRTWGGELVSCSRRQLTSLRPCTMHITIVQPKWRNLFILIPAHQWQTINHKVFETKCCWLSKSLDHRKNLEGRKKVFYFENKHNFSSPPKNAWVTRRDKHTKKLESNNYAGTLPWKVFHCITRALKMIRQCFYHVTARNLKFAVSQWPNSHPFDFCMKRNYITVTQFQKYCTASWKQIIRHSKNTGR